MHSTLDPAIFTAPSELILAYKYTHKAKKCASIELVGVRMPKSSATGSVLSDVWAFPIPVT